MENEDYLFEAVKRRLRITYSGYDDDIKELIQEGKSYLVSKTGELPFDDLDSDLGTNARSLLKIYCQYHWNNNGHLFEGDLRSQIIALQIEAAKAKRQAKK